MTVEFSHRGREFVVEGTLEEDGGFTTEQVEIDGDVIEGEGDIEALEADDGWVEALMSAVSEALDEMPDDLMDGDHQSALASAGMGTDEDYGSYCEDFG